MRGRARARLDIFKGRFCISLDTDDRQNDDGCRFSGVGAAKAHQAPIVRKFYDVTHRLSPLTAGANPSARSTDVGVIAIRRHPRLTLC
jgi:hypothetical protein